MGSGMVRAWRSAENLDDLTARRKRFGRRSQLTLRMRWARRPDPLIGREEDTGALPRLT